MKKIILYSGIFVMASSLFAADCGQCPKCGAWNGPHQTRCVYCTLHGDDK